MKLLFVFSLLLSFSFSYAQDFYNIDSLKLSLEHAKYDTSKVLTMAALSFNYAFAQPDTGVLYGQQAIVSTPFHRQFWVRVISSVDLLPNTGQG